jgi:mannan polymerase II complex MNN10 subunit
MTIGVFTFHDSLFQPVADITVPVLRAYCERHGYPLTVATERLSTQRIVWDKIPLLLENLHENNWSFFIDSDVLITNPMLKLEEFLIDVPIQSDFVLSHDMNGPNLGVFFVRNSVAARVILSDAWHMRDRADIGSEQHAIVEAMRDCERCLVTHVPQKRFNSYAYEDYDMPATTEGNWTPGDFAMHLPGMTVEKRVEVFRKYLK